MGDYHSAHTGQIIDATISAVIAGKAGIQGVKVNGTEITPDTSSNKVDISVPVVSQSTGSSTTEVMSQSAVTTSLSNKADSSSLSTVATSGSYTDLSNKPTIPTVSNYTSTLSSSSWTESSGTYTQTVSIQGILSTDTPIIDVSNPTQAMLDSWAYVSKIETSNDSITATCFSNQPTENINIKLMVVR